MFALLQKSRPSSHCLRGLIAATLVFQTSGCTNWARPVAPNPWSETILKESFTENPLRGRNSKRVDIERDGDRLHIIVKRLCKVTNHQTVERSGTVEYANDNVGATALYFAVGAAAAAGAIALGVHTAPELLSDDPEEQSAGGSKLVGVGLLGLLGAGGLTAGTIKTFSALRSEEKTETITRQKSIPDRPCERARQRTVKVKVKLEPEQRAYPRYVRLGSTDNKGELVVKLSDVLPPRWLSSNNPVERARVVVDGRKAGTIEITSLAGNVSDKSWAKLKPAISRCKKSTSRGGCYAIKRFIKAHPKSPRIDDAEQLLKEHRERQHDHAWTKAKIKECAKPQKSTDCRGVKRYLRRYPKGKHAAESRRILKRVDKKLNQLSKIEEARDAREDQAEERREAARERREAAQRKRQCLKDCRSDINSCNRSCRGLSSAAACRRSCRNDFISCEFDCAREERGVTRRRRKSRKSSITVRIGGNKPRSACGKCRAAWRRQCPHSTSLCSKVISNNCAGHCN